MNNSQIVKPHFIAVVFTSPAAAIIPVAPHYNIHKIEHAMYTIPPEMSNTTRWVDREPGTASFSSSSLLTVLTSTPALDFAGAPLAVKTISVVVSSRLVWPTPAPSRRVTSSIQVYTALLSMRGRKMICQRGKRALVYHLFTARLPSSST